ncbi:MAG: NADH-quinone oxidoreductase subunit NuoE [Planctomycetota bacterium]|nr:NADH-quinone oxidoreductase subunit NuoE [Planctomycetota bacterium]
MPETIGMAWITKNSAGMKVQRRAEPYLTSAMREELTRTILPRYETKHAALLPALHMVQHAEGWIPPQAMLEIAEFLSITPGDVQDTASFYEEYWIRPRGRRIVSVCRSLACECMGHQKITDACREALGIEVGETTDDDSFTLVEVECLGSCDTAPVALIDDHLHENLTPEAMKLAIAKARAAAPHGHGPGQADQHANGHH